jgi:hypothetical protein
MTLRNVALITAGKVINIALVEDDPSQWPSYVRACNPPDVDVLAQLAETCDACVELHDGEMCEPGALVKVDAAPELVPAREGEKVGVVRVQVDAEGKAVKPVAERFERSVLVVEEQPTQVIK